MQWTTPSRPADGDVPETLRVHTVILRPRFGWTAGVVVTIGVLCLLAGAGFLVALVSTAVPVDFLAVVLTVVAFGFGATAMPLLLIGRTGQLHLDAEGLRIEHTALLRRPWDVPGTSIRFVRYAPPRLSGVWTSGLAPSHDTIEIRFREPFPTMPIRYRFLIYAAVTASGPPATLPVPGIRIEALTIRVDLDSTDRHFLDRLTFQSETPSSTTVD